MDLHGWHVAEGTTGAARQALTYAPMIGRPVPRGQRQRGDQVMAMVVDSALYIEGHRDQSVSIDAAKPPDQPGRFVWIGLLEPSEEMLRTVQARFNLHDLAIEDAHRAHQRPKLEVYDHSLFVVLRTAELRPTDRASSASSAPRA